MSFGLSTHFINLYETKGKEKRVGMEKLIDNCPKASLFLAVGVYCKSRCLGRESTDPSSRAPAGARPDEAAEQAALLPERQRSWICQRTPGPRHTWKQAEIATDRSVAKPDFCLETCLQLVGPQFGGTPALSTESRVHLVLEAACSQGNNRVF